jgi:hypothetical protein
MAYEHNNRDPNLNNLHHAMELVDDIPHVRVTLGSDNITITGDVNLVDTVTVNSTPEDPVHIHITEIGTSGLLAVPYMPIQGTVTVNQPVAVTDNNSSLTVDGTVSLSNDTLTALENINATVTGSVSVSNFPASQAVTGTFWPATQPVSGTVTIQDGGNIITVNGTVTADVTFPTTQQVSGTVALDTATLTALENIGVTGTVELGTTTLAALENTTVTISGTPTVNIGTIPEVEIKNDTGNPIPISATTAANTALNPIYVEGSVTIDQTAGDPTLVKYINTPNNLQMDMTQRLRVSAPTQSWWYAPTVDKDGDLRYIESNVGANSGSVFVQNLASINMTSGTAANGSFIRISRRRHKMRPGVSMSAQFAINWNGWVPDGKVVKRAGVFTNYNGIFYEMTGDLQVVIRRRLTDGTLVEQRIARADFTIDKLDGTGETGYDLRPVISETSALTAFVSKTAVPITGDGTVYRVVFTVADPTAFAVSKKGRITGVTPELYNGTVLVSAINGNNVTVVYTHDPGVFSSIGTGNFVHTAFHHHYTFGFDFNGNRTTSVRFFIDGPLGRVAIHQENFGGELGSPFFNAPAVSTRYEIFNTAAPGRMPAFSCSSEVINVEAEAELNPGFGVATNNTPVTYAKNGTATHPVLGLALRAGEPYQRSDLQIQGVTFADIANINQQNAGVFYWRLVFNPTIGGTVPASIDVGKSTRYWKYTAATTVSGGIDLLSGYASSTQQFDVRSALNFVNLGSNIEYTDSDKIVLVVQQLVGGTSDAQLVATINFIEAL